MIKFTYKKKPKKNSPTLNTNAFFFIYQFQMYLLHHEMYQNTFESHPFQKNLLDHLMMADRNYHSIHFLNRLTSESDIPVRINCIKY